MPVYPDCPMMSNVVVRYYLEVWVKYSMEKLEYSMEKLYLSRVQVHLYGIHKKQTIKMIAVITLCLYKWVVGIPYPLRNCFFFK